MWGKSSHVEVFSAKLQRRQHQQCAPARIELGLGTAWKRLEGRPRIALKANSVAYNLGRTNQCIQYSNSIDIFYLLLSIYILDMHGSIFNFFVTWNPRFNFTYSSPGGRRSEFTIFNYLAVFFYGILVWDWKKNDFFLIIMFFCLYVCL